MPVDKQTTKKTPPPTDGQDKLSAELGDDISDPIRQEELGQETARPDPVATYAEMAQPAVDTIQAIMDRQQAITDAALSGDVEVSIITNTGDIDAETAMMALLQSLRSHVLQNQKPLVDEMKIHRTLYDNATTLEEKKEHLSNLQGAATMLLELNSQDKAQSLILGNPALSEALSANSSESHLATVMIQGTKLDKDFSTWQAVREKEASTRRAEAPGGWLDEAFKEELGEWPD